MASNVGQTFGDDAPKSNPWTEDRLDYASFARRLAQVIIGLAAPNGYVIGLHGQWGSGKSTAINFVLAYLKKHNDENEGDQIVHIDFRAWIIAGHQDLISAFFKVLSEKLKPTRSGPVGLFRKPLGSIRGTTDSLVDTAAIGDSGKRFLVTIDDIDRLEKSDIRSIMQRVKSIGQLPNVTYLLAYDRRIVATALDTAAHDGPQFAEKIVQQELELPSPSQNALLSMLDKEIAFLTAETPTTIRWQYIVRDGVHRWIRSPRDVARLSNAIKFLWPAIAGEVDPQDVLCMEGLRLFDEVVFNWVSGNKDLLFQQGRFQLSSEQRLQDAFERLKSEIAEAKREPLLKLLSVILGTQVRHYTMRDRPDADLYQGP